MAHVQPASDLYGAPSALNVTAVLGPTNTGKTHLAIERMLGHQSGLIGLPLRLLAREVYDKIVQRVGVSEVALITGEEKIKPRNARYWVSTVEAMPRDLDVEFVAVDEIQLAADPERGHVFTDRLFHARGSEETLLLGAETMRDALIQLLPGVNFISRPRLSKLTYAGPKKISRLPRRSAIVAFSINDVYEIAEFVRRQRGGAAVVLGALSPRTRNAQVEMFQSGDVDFLVATDAIGMGLNLDVQHVAFAGVHKFDGVTTRELMPSELAQIAGRAGRHIQDGTFGVTGNVPPLASDLINRIEAHDFDPARALQWRTRSLDFSNVPQLLACLKQAPGRPYLMKARDADDVLALEALASDEKILDMAKGSHNVQRLWDVCQVPDYRKIGASDHSELVRQIFHFIMQDNERIPADWFVEQIEQHNRFDGDIDTLATRIAHIRTWTFVANRNDWLEDPVYWQERTREIEDKLSDAMHEGLTKRFVDQRTNTLMKRLHERGDLFVEVDKEGLLHVEDHFVGKISGFQFTPDCESAGIDGRAARSAAFKVLTKELSMRSKDMIAAPLAEFRYTSEGKILWRDAVVGELLKGDSILKPRVNLLADEQLSGPAREETEAKLDEVVNNLIEEKLHPLVQLSQVQDLSGLARGVAFQLIENLGVLAREPIAEDIRQLDQEARGHLRKFGVRFGAFNIFFPLLLKPAATDMARVLWKIFHEKMELGAAWELPKAGLTSAAYNRSVESDYYRISGFHVCGGRVVRVDMLERLADLIRPLVNWRAAAQPKTKPLTDKNPKTVADMGPESSETEVSQQAIAKTSSAQNDGEVKADVPDGGGAAPAAHKKPEDISAKAPTGATGDGGFIIVPDMMSIMGCSADELGDVLRALGFQATKQKPIAEQNLQTGDPQTGAAKSKDDGVGDVTDVVAMAKAPSETKEPVETKEIIIWRPRKKSGGHRQGRANQRRPAKRAAKYSDQKGGSGKGRGADKPKNQAKRGKSRNARTEPKIDPDSPFAKLQVLKEQIKDKAG